MSPVGHADSLTVSVTVTFSFSGAPTSMLPPIKVVAVVGDVADLPDDVSSDERAILSDPEFVLDSGVCPPGRLSDRAVREAEGMGV